MSRFIIDITSEQLAQKFHETYEQLASLYGYETRKESAKPWVNVPPNNKSLMIAVCDKIIEEMKKNIRQMTIDEIVKECGKWRISDEECERLMR